jgi:hypothetical protein
MQTRNSEAKLKPGIKLTEKEQTDNRTEMNVRLIFSVALIPVPTQHLSLIHVSVLFGFCLANAFSSFPYSSTLSVLSKYMFYGIIF